MIAPIIQRHLVSCLQDHSKVLLFLTGSLGRGLATNMAEAAKGAMNEIDEFKKLLTSPETTRVLERAKQSEKENPRGIKPYKVAEDFEWPENNAK